MQAIEPRHIIQKHRFGCGVACLAMVSGKTYEEVAADFGDPDASFGLHTFAVEVWLAEHGYATSMIPRFKTGSIQREPWPPSPWADAHLVNVQIPGGLHWVVWWRNGDVFDPQKLGAFAIDDYNINNIMGVHRVK